MDKIHKLAEFGGGNISVDFIWEDGTEKYCVQYKANTTRGVHRILHRFNGAQRTIKAQTDDRQNQAIKYSYKWLAMRCCSFSITTIKENATRRKTFTIQ